MNELVATEDQYTVFFCGEKCGRLTGPYVLAVTEDRASGLDIVWKESHKRKWGNDDFAPYYNGLLVVGIG